MIEPPDTLEGVFDDAWRRLQRGAHDRRSGFHTGVLATQADDGPDARTVVLRGADRTQRVLRIHSDARSAKLAQIERSALACFVVYQSPVQLRLRGRISVHAAGDPTMESAWAGSRPGSRRCYLVEPGPGNTLEQPGDGLPEVFRERAPSLDESEAGRAHFRVLLLQVETLDWLWLAASGHRRAHFQRSEQGFDGHWCVP